jgi:hypothetical protein
MKRFSMVAIACCSLPLTIHAKTLANAVNLPTVQSAFGGSYYVRSIPDGDAGATGKTQVFKVKKERDELLDEYPLYMRGTLYLGWSPLKAKWCLIHVEPAQILNDIYGNSGKVTHLVFYMGGKEIVSYSDADLQQYGLMKNVATLQDGAPGQFIIQGVEQIPLTNNYVFTIEKLAQNKKGTEKLLFDITTGKLFESAAPSSHR